MMKTFNRESKISVFIAIMITLMCIWSSVADGQAFLGGAGRVYAPIEPQSDVLTDGICRVGDVLAPGESCTDPGTGDIFSVLNNGQGEYLTNRSGSRIAYFGNINGKVRSFDVRLIGNEKWQIHAVTGTAPPPPVTGTAPLPLVDPDSPQIYWTDSDSYQIQRANLDGSNIQTLHTGPGLPAGIALDVASGNMYWTDRRQDKIQRANLDGTNVETLFNTVDPSGGVALDVVGGKIYWTVGPISEASQGKIQRANLDGTNVETLVTGILDTPDYITLDVPGGKMYWTFSGFDGSEIQRANLDGTNVQTIIRWARFGGYSGGVALDVGGGKMYWTDWNLYQILRANLDGSNIQTLVNTGRVFTENIRLLLIGGDRPWGIALDVPGGKMYWTTHPIGTEGRGKIQRANLDGTNVETLVTGLDSPDYIAIGIRDPAALVISSGNNQNGTPNSQLTAPLVVQVLDAANTGIADVEVDFSVTGGQGSFGTADEGQDVYAVTNAEGFAEVPFTPTSASTVTVQASVSGLDPVAFTVNAGPPPALPAKLIKVSGDTQSGQPRTRLANPLVVEVQDKDDTPMEGVSVTFRITAGGGTLSATTVTTGKNGRAQTFLTLGATRAVNRVEASVSGIDTPVTFRTSIEATVHIAAANRPPMYWVDTDAGTLHRLVGAKVENLIPSVQNATGLAVDLTNSKLYWTEKTTDRTGRIRRANLDGSDPQLIKDLTSAPLYIAVDTANGKLYLINSWNKIQRMNLDGTAFQPNLVTGLQTPKGLTVDAAGGKVYWIEQTGDRAGKISRANLDGSEVKVIKTLTSVPQGIALDATSSKVYITNAYGKVQRMNLDGSSYQPNLITGLTAPMNVAVDAAGRKVYWAEGGSLRRADLNGENVQDVVTGSGPITSLVLGTMPVDNGAPAAPAVTAAASSQKNAMLANYPNPCNPETWIPYQLSEPANVTLTIYGVNGQVVRELALGHQVAGEYQSRSRAAYWDGRNTFGEPVASGLYFYTLTAGDFTATRKMLIRK